MEIKPCPCGGRVKVLGGYVEAAQISCPSCGMTFDPSRLQNIWVSREEVVEKWNALFDLPSSPVAEWKPDDEVGLIAIEKSPGKIGIRHWIVYFGDLKPQVQTALLGAPKGEAGKFIDFVCDGPPGPEGGRFVEVENEQGKSINAGEWIQKDGYWVLRVFLNGEGDSGALGKLKELVNKKMDELSRYTEVRMKNGEWEDCGCVNSAALCTWHEIARDVKQAIASLSSSPSEPERDFTPEEVKKEAVKRWGQFGRGKFDSISAPNYRFTVGDGTTWYQGPSFRAAFAAADKSKEKGDS